MRNTPIHALVLVLVLAGCESPGGGGRISSDVVQTTNTTDATSVTTDPTDASTATDATTTSTTAPDSEVTDVTVTDTSDVVVPTTSVTDTSSDTDTVDCNQVCAGRECGVRQGCNCGTCDPGQNCDGVTNQCEDAGAALGSFCGPDATCNPSSPTYPDCLDEKCDSGNCLSNNGSAFILRDVCSKACTVGQANGCTGAVDGPAGDEYACANFASAGSSPVGLCVPGSDFAECQSDVDCPAGEGCEISTIGGDIGLHCVARYRENASWDAEVNGLAGDCNDDPRVGDLSYCASGLCFGLGCVTNCTADTDCDTTKTYANTGCNTQTQKCRGNDAKSCTQDIHCSSWECGDPRQIFSDGAGGLTGPELELCWPKQCTLDAQCGGGFYCRFFWNGVGGDDAGLENRCLAQDPTGANKGQPCDDDTPCKNTDLCIGGYCSSLCGTDADCAAASGQVCALAELPGDEDDDGVDDFVLPVEWCQTYPGGTGTCLSDSDCTGGRSCQLYTIENPSVSGRTDAPQLLTGKCTAATGGTFGAPCADGTECRSGFCLGATASEPGACAKACSSTASCGDPVEPAGSNGQCSALLYTYGGDISDDTNNVYIPLCTVTTSSLENCAGDFDCTLSNEFCGVNVIATDPTHAPTVEYLCQAIVEPNETMPTRTLGQTCDPNATTAQCATGYCLTNDSGQSFCSRLCDGGDACGNGTTCTERPLFERSGQYAGNTVNVGVCWK